jgi:hypothetical protein
MDFSINREYIYLIREREYIRCNLPIYKIGKTKQEPHKRFQGYPKDTEGLILIQVQNCDKSEKLLLKRFKEKYRHVHAAGAEYFEGDINNMIQSIIEVALPIYNTDSVVFDTTKPGEAVVEALLQRVALMLGW